MLALLQVPESDPFYDLYVFGWEMETPLLIASVLFTLLGLRRVLPLSLHRLYARQPNPGIGLARAAIGFAALWFWLVLLFGAASDIVDWYYNALYAFFALAILLWAGFRFPILGVYYPADVLERGNLAAGLVFAGFAMGTAFAFGGALTGEGPGWWVVAVFFVLAYGELRGNMALVGRLGRIDEEMRLDRDASAGLLLGAVALASGLVSGRAAAGDFHGWQTDLPDYARRLWPLAAIALGGTLVGAYSRFSDRKAQIRAAFSALLVASAFLWYFLT